MQRVAEASVSVDGTTVGSIQRGLLVFVGVATDDNEQDAQALGDKVANLRCFEDAEGLINLSVKDTGGSILAIAQFTLLADCRKGRRPSLIDAARPEKAIPLYEAVIRHLREHHIPVATGEFGAHMDVALTNDGPVTLLLDTKKVF